MESGSNQACNKTVDNRREKRGGRKGGRSASMFPIFFSPFPIVCSNVALGLLPSGDLEMEMILRSDGI